MNADTTTTIRLYWLAVAVMMLSPVPAAVGDTNRLKEFEEARKWFQSLGVPDSSGKDFVCVTVREQNATREPRLVKTYGFVLTKYQSRLSIVTLDLRWLNLVHISDQGAGNARMEIEQASLKEYATRAMAGADIYQEEVSRGFNWERGTNFAPFRIPLGLSSSARDFVLALACFQRELPDVGRQLANRAVDTKRRMLPASTLADELHVELFTVFTDRAIASLGNPAVTREDVLGQLEWIMQSCAPKPNWPASWEWRVADSAIAVLRRMQNEDKNWRPPKHAATNTVTPDALVYALRNQTQIDGWTPGFKSPGEQLLDLGERAVPALIDAIGDDRYTRHIENLEAVIPKPTCLTIGEYSLFLLERIAGEGMPVAYVGVSEDRNQVDRNKEILRSFWKDRNGQQK